MLLLQVFPSDHTVVAFTASSLPSASALHPQISYIIFTKPNDSIYLSWGHAASHQDESELSCYSLLLIFAELFLLPSVGIAVSDPVTEPGSG